MFPKIQPDYVHTTQSGSRRTAVVLGVCLLLCLNETWTYLSNRYSYSSTVRVDTTTGQKLAIAGATFQSCCNTCDSLLAAYGKKGWNTRDVLNDSEQCLLEKRGQRKVALGQGCRLSGTMLVNKVAGNFHVAMGESMVRDGRHIHQFLPEDAPNYNVTHEV
ncbi:hypothetical protein TrRE_jg4657 [Triparma retinervis]|uniref:Uncharacterized protein n=1 Tax=Triparma retinervis TaxID=2557542 RepID=A0A9W7CDV1_9STRA|nr:hypothetical protein TrRE_jg4657 [Triparma retinervis]